MITTSKRFGKYEGNHSQMVAEAAHNAALNGSDETVGDVQEYGWIADKVIGKRYVFIVLEDSDGFVDVEVFKIGDPAADTNWNAMLALAEEADAMREDGQE